VSGYRLGWGSLHFFKAAFAQLFYIMNYSVVLRAHEVSPLIVRAVRCLRAQSLPPQEIVVVDSSGSRQVARRLGELVDVHVAYDADVFNYSRAIQLGVDAASADHVLVHSAHVALKATHLVEDAFHRAAAANCAVFYFRKGASAAVDNIDVNCFDGRNGLANSCAMIPRDLLLQRGFREEVFSAEDQEWAAWFIREQKGSVLRITSPSCVYDNPYLNIQKKVNEDLAIACFVNRRERWPHNIAMRLGRALLALVRRRPERARLHWRVAIGLMGTYFRPPRQKSRYF